MKTLIRLALVGALAVAFTLPAPQAAAQQNCYQCLRECGLTGQYSSCDCYDFCWQAGSCNNPPPSCP